MIGIIGAMEEEVSLLLDAMTERQTVTVGKTDFHTGTLQDKAVVVARCGIGKVCAALCTQIMVDRFAVDCVINTGVAGGLHPSLAVGDLVLCTYAVQHDFDVTALGYVRGYLCDGTDGSKPTRFEADASLRRVFAEAAASLHEPITVHEGVIASGDLFVSGADVKAELRRTFDATAAEMEGAAIAQAATANGIPFMVVRAISDLADGSAKISYEQFETQAAKRCARLTQAALERM